MIIQRIMFSVTKNEVVDIVWSTEIVGVLRRPTASNDVGLVLCNGQELPYVSVIEEVL